MNASGLKDALEAAIEAAFSPRNVAEVVMALELIDAMTGGRLHPGSRVSQMQGAVNTIIADLEHASARTDYPHELTIEGVTRCIATDGYRSSAWGVASALITHMDSEREACADFLMLVTLTVVEACKGAHTQPHTCIKPLTMYQYWLRMYLREWKSVWACVLGCIPHCDAVREHEHGWYSALMNACLHETQRREPLLLATLVKAVHDNEVLYMPKTIRNIRVAAKMVRKAFERRGLVKAGDIWCSPPGARSLFLPHSNEDYHEHSTLFPFPWHQSP